MARVIMYKKKSYPDETPGGGGGEYMVYYGTSAPSSSIGENGDEYYRLNSSNEIIQKFIKLGTNWTDQSETPITLISKTIIANGTYIASDDSADGYDEVVVNVPSSGGTTKYLLYGAQDTSQSNWVLGDMPLDVINSHASDMSDYLSYNSSTKTLTVVKAFCALITFWVYQAYNADNRGNINLKINGNSVRSSRTASTSAGSVGGDNYVFNLSIGDTIKISNPENEGWGFGRIKVYSMVDGEGAYPVLNE